MSIACPNILNFQLSESQKDLWGSSGIYKITNIKSNNFYIGSAIRLSKRFEAHRRLLLNTKHHNLPLQRVVNKHGIEILKVEILELCKKEDLITREQYYIDSLKPPYNICKIAGSLLGYKASEETKIKLSKAGKGKRKPEGFGEKVSKGLKGIKKSKEHVEKMIKSMTGRKLSQEHVEKIRSKAIGRKYIITQKIIDNIKRLASSDKRIENLKRGEEHPNSKLSNTEVLDIKQMIKNNIPNKVIYSKYSKISPRTIRKIKNNQIWRNI